VHVPVVILPLAAVGAVATMVKRSWYFQYRWVVLILGAVGALGAILATSTGEELEEGERVSEAIREHAEAGELARTVAIVFVIVLVGYVVVPWILARRAMLDERRDQVGPKWLRPVLIAAVALTSIASVATVIDAGHSGASSVWNESEREGDDD
jgi:NhaP-type Na+/H+ or K+/H+ antiporter